MVLAKQFSLGKYWEMPEHKIAVIRESEDRAGLLPMPMYIVKVNPEFVSEQANKSTKEILHYISDLIRDFAEERNLDKRRDFALDLEDISKIYYKNIIAHDRDFKSYRLASDLMILLLSNSRQVKDFPTTFIFYKNFPDLDKILDSLIGQGKRRDDIFYTHPDQQPKTRSA